jgi:non-ribosomal peptide synthase protein (TIGR01720 family)
LDEADTRRLLGVVTEGPSKPEEALLAALARGLARWTGRTTVLVELEAHGRDEALADVDLSRTVGWFTTIHPALLQLPAIEDAASCLEAVRRQARAIPRRGVGYGVLRHLAGPESARLLADVPRPMVIFNYLGRFLDAAPAMAGAPWRIVATHQTPMGVPLHVNAFASGGRLTLVFTYSRALHHRATIEGFAAAFVDDLRDVLEAQP